MRHPMQCVLGIAVAALTLTATAQAPIAYPAKGQSTQKQHKDEGECFAWARQTTGVDPATASKVPQETGPAAGGGAMRGGREARQNQSARNQQAQAGFQQALNAYYGAYGACMSGRGYTIN